MISLRLAALHTVQQINRLIKGTCVASQGNRVK